MYKTEQTDNSTASPNLWAVPRDKINIKPIKGPIEKTILGQSVTKLFFLACWVC